jgi:hypothetical protein
LCYQVVSAHPILVAGIELFIKFGQWPPNPLTIGTKSFFV